jgi:hypothetical protein
MMRTFQIRSLAVSALAVLVLPGQAAAQQSPPLLNTLEVQQLVGRSEPDDNARLAAHFTALADRYVSEAKQHTTMTNAYAGNAGRGLAAGMQAHCRQLSDLNTQSATEARDLAMYHQKLASGRAATAPSAGFRLEGGSGSPAPTKQDLAALAATASTPADHRALEEYFVTLAKRYTKDASDFATTANTFRGTKMGSAAAHGDTLARLSERSAREATKAGAMHGQLAGLGR